MKINDDDDDNLVDVNSASLDVFEAAGFILNCHDKDQLSLSHNLGGINILDRMQWWCAIVLRRKGYSWQFAAKTSIRIRLCHKDLRNCC